MAHIATEASRIQPIIDSAEESERDKESQNTTVNATPNRSQENVRSSA